MFCPNCGRLNPDDTESCKFCGFELNNEQAQPGEELLKDPSIEQYSQPVKERKGEYFKYGRLICVAVVLVIAGIIALIAVNVSSPAEKAVKAYAKGYYESSLEQTMEHSALDLQKYYQVSSQSSFENFFGLFSQYSSYEQMLSAYSAEFQSRKESIVSTFGDDYDVDIDIKKTQKLSTEESYQLYQSYLTSSGDVLKDGEKSDIRLIYANVTVESEIKTVTQTYCFAVAEIGGNYCVMTDTSYAPWRIYG